MTRHRKKDVRCRGTALVEAAIVLELILLVTLGALEYGWMFLMMQRITNAARHGARLEAAAGAVAGEAQAAMASLLADLPGSCVATVEADADDMVRATVTVPSEDVRLIHWDLLPMPVNLQAVVRMAKEAS